MEIKQALAELRKEKKRKFDQTVDVIINLKNFDVRKEALNTFVPIPHAGSKKLAAFLTKRSKIIDSFVEDDFSKYKTTADLKKFAKKYDAFIAVAPMMTKIATTFGRVLGPMSKMPSPQAGIILKDDDDSIASMIDKMNKVVRVKNKELAIKLPAGKESMSDKDLEENITSIISNIEAKLPRKNDNIKEVLIKFTMTKPLVIVERR